MRLYLIAAATLLLSACGPSVNTPDINTGGDIIIDGQSVGEAPAPKIPDLPENLKKKAGRLPALTDRTVEGQQKSAIETDKAYNAVAFQLNAVIDAWSCVRKTLNDKKDPEVCFK